MTAVDFLIENATILTVDPGRNVLTDGFIGIAKNRIACLGAGGSPDLTAKQRIDAKGGIVMPGLVNAHTHAAMTLFRGLADDLPLMDWLQRFIFPVEQRMDAKFVEIGTRLACAEMIRSGTTTFCDMYLFTNAVARVADETGMRAVVGEVLYDFPSPNYGEIENGFAYTDALLNQWRGHARVSIAVEPHAPYTCAPELLVQANRMAKKNNARLILHLAETQTEVNDIQDRYGCTPVEHLNALGVIGPHLVADHCVHLTESDMDCLATHDARVVHNPQSNMKLASGIAPVPALLSRGITVGLGTDGCASNNNLDMFTEMDTAAKLHKVATLDPTVISAPQALAMATIDSARCLGLDDQIGSLEVGKLADIIVLDADAAHLTPIYDPTSHAVYAARGSDVRHTFIHGEPVMLDRQIITVDMNRMLSDARRMAEQVKVWTHQVNGEAN